MPTPGGNVQMWKVTVKNGRRRVEDMCKDRVTSNEADSIEKRAQALGYTVNLKKVR